MKAKKNYNKGGKVKGLLKELNSMSSKRKKNTPSITGPKKKTPSIRGPEYREGGKFDPKKKIEKGKDLIFNKAQKASQEGKFKKADRMVKRGARKIGRAVK